MKMLLLVIAMLAAIVGPAHAQCGSNGVYVFGAYWCPACRTTEQFLTNYGIGHQRFEVTDNQQVQQFMREHFGGTTIPVVVVDGSFRLGYDAAWLQDVLCIR
jgi:glutaredoxin